MGSEAKRKRESVAVVLVCGSLAGLLIWSKLRLVSDLPRSAYAVPRDAEMGIDPDDAATQDDSSATPTDASGRTSRPARPRSEN